MASKYNSVRIALTSSVTAIGKHLFCTVGNGLVIFPDFARAFNGRAQRPPLVVDLNGAPISFAHCDHHVVLCTPSAFYILDASQFDDATSPAHLEAVRIDRCGVLASTGYGHRTNNDEKGATARVTVTPGSIYEVLKIDRIWWVEKEKWDGVRDETPVDHCECHLRLMALTTVVRIYNFE